MAIRYISEGTLFKTHFHTAPYLSIFFGARFFWDTWYVQASAEGMHLKEQPYIRFLICFDKLVLQDSRLIEAGGVTRPSFLRSSITLELLDLLLTLFEERYLLGSLFVPAPVILMLAMSN